MKKSTAQNIIKFILFMFPFLVILLSIFRNGTYDFVSIESYFAPLRNYDFGLSNYIIEHLFNNQQITLILFMFDIGIYTLYYTFIDTMYLALRYFIEMIRGVMEKCLQK